MEQQLSEILRGMFRNVLQDIAEHGFNGKGDVEAAKNAISGLLKLRCLEEMGERGGSSWRGSSARHSRDDGGYSNRSHSQGNSESRRSYERGHSGHDSGLRQKLEQLMQETGDERERQRLHDMLEWF